MLYKEITFSDWTSGVHHGSLVCSQEELLLFFSSDGQKSQGIA